MALRVPHTRAAIPRTAPDTTVPTTTVTTIARPTTVATDPFWAYRACSRIPPGPGIGRIRALSAQPCPSAATTSPTLPAVRHPSRWCARQALPARLCLVQALPVRVARVRCDTRGAAQQKPVDLPMAIGKSANCHAVAAKGNFCRRRGNALCHHIRRSPTRLVRNESRNADRALGYRLFDPGRRRHGHGVANRML